MKKTIIALALTCALPTAALAYRGASTYGYGTGSSSNSTGVSGYSRSNGTYVQPYQRTAPDATQYNNYGTRGNYNPYSGQTGTNSPRY